MSVRRYKRDRPTIGVLAGWSSHQSATSDHYRGSVVPGIQAGARSRGCHLLISWGTRQITDLSHLYPSWPLVTPESDFVPVGPWNTDGLIVFTPLQSEDRSRYLQQLMADGFPVLFIATGEQGPSISVDNEIGIRQAVEHLAEHGHRRIAFLAGQPTDKGDSEIRLKAYRAALSEFNLEADPRLVVWGWHNYMESYKAMRELLTGGAGFTSALASNDNSAIGAMRAIREAGLNIPRDIAIIGFDDQPGSIAQVPPLTTVHAPLNLIGEQAVLMLLDHISGQAPLESVQVPTRLARRQSCGCLPEVVSSAVGRPRSGETSFTRRYSKRGIRKAEKQLVSEMLSALPSVLRYPGEEQFNNICTDFVRAFYTSLKHEDATHFQTAFRESIQMMEMADVNIDYWQDMISFLRREMVSLPANWRMRRTRTLAEDMLHQARAIIGESMQRQDPRHQYQLAASAGILYEITSRLSSALSDAHLVELLNTNLPEIGIRHARILLFEAEPGDPVAWSVALGSEAGSAGRRFPSREFPPPDLYPPDELLTVYVLPLVFQSEPLGYVVFDARDPGACEVINRQLAATIKVSRLHAQVVELSLTDTLTGLRNRRYLDLFLQTEIPRSRRFSHDLAVIMADIDHFKDYNDQYGHAAGDQALQAVATCLTRNRRSADVVARIGGEEFVVLLPETDRAGALNVAEQLRISVADIPELKRPITVSLGVAGFSERVRDADTLLERADQALYEAKNTGRNRICAFEESP